MSNLTEHAKREFAALGYTPPDLDTEDGPNKWIPENVLQLLEVFSEQGHSGSSAPFAIGYFENLESFEPLCPLTGEDDEWNNTGDNTLQNNRCSHVFKDIETGEAYDSHGKVFREPNGVCYTSRDSRTPVTFPYTPKTEYVDVAAPGAAEEDE